MPITKSKKVELVADLDAKLEGVQSIVFVGFKKLSVKDTIALRRSLRAQGVGYTVLKKTLMKRVLASRGVTGEIPELPGEIALAYSSDLTAPAREVFAFAQTHKEQVSIVGGVFEGKFMSQSEMLVIATIPPREVLLSQIAFLLKSPIQRLAISVNEVAKQKSA